MLFGLQEVHGQRRHQSAGQDIRRDHGEDDSFSERDKEELCNAAQKEHGQKHDADTQGGNQRRNGNLRCAIEDANAQFGALFKMALDIFDGDGGIVDKDADGERKVRRAS